MSSIQPNKFDIQLLPNTILLVAVKKRIQLRPMKLQKLMYFACGRFVAHASSGESLEAWWLIPQNFFAFPYGPVEREVYTYYKEYGDTYIDNLMKKGLCFGTKSERGKKRLETIDRVVREYGSLDDMELSEKTHIAGGPWYEVWNKWNGEKPYKEIDKETIYEHFRRAENSV